MILAPNHVGSMCVRRGVPSPRITAARFGRRAFRAAIGAHRVPRSTAARSLGRNDRLTIGANRIPRHAAARLRWRIDHFTQNNILVGRQRGVLRLPEAQPVLEQLAALFALGVEIFPTLLERVIVRIHVVCMRGILGFPGLLGTRGPFGPFGDLRWPLEFLGRLLGGSRLSGDTGGRRGGIGTRRGIRKPRARIAPSSMTALASCSMRWMS